MRLKLLWFVLTASIFNTFSIETVEAQKQINCIVDNPNPNLITKTEWSGKCINNKASGFGVATYWNDDLIINTVDGYFEAGNFVVGKRTPRSGKTQYCLGQKDCVTDWGDYYAPSFVAGGSKEDGDKLFKLIMAEIDRKFRSFCETDISCSSSDFSKIYKTLKKNDTICSTNVPNPNPLPKESADFFGDCKDGKPISGIVMWKQSGVPFGLSCIVNGEIDDTVDSAIGFDKCSKYKSLIPDFCSKADYRGQCLNDKPHGVGRKFWQESAGFGSTNYMSLDGQFENGRASGYISVRKLEKCGYFGCAGNNKYFAWYQNGEEQYRCDGGPDGCRKQKAAIPVYQQAELAAKNFRCEEALKLDRQAQTRDGQKHNDSDHSNGYKINFSGCVAERTLNTHLKGKNPQSMYLAAGQYERKGENYNARKIYDAIVERFPSSTWAVKANDRLLSIKADSDASSRQSDFESNRRYEREKDAQACRNRKASCSSSCTSLSSSSSRSDCYSRCNSICSE